MPRPAHQVGRRQAAAGQWIRRRINWRLGVRVYNAGVRRHGRALDCELDHRAAIERGDLPHVTSNARFALLLLAMTVLTGFSRQLLGPVFELLPKWGRTPSPRSG